METNQNHKIGDVIYCHVCNRSHVIDMKILKRDRNRVPVAIEWEYKGITGTYIDYNGVKEDKEYNWTGDDYPGSGYDDGLNTYWWREGNASCDCNRSIFFFKSVNLEELECGQTIQVTKIRRLTNEEIVRAQVIIDRNNSRPVTQVHVWYCCDTNLTSVDVTEELKEGM